MNPSGHLASSIGIAALALACILLVGNARGETDHLKGYSIKDLGKVQPVGTQTIVTQFGTETCTLRKAQLFLVAAEKNAGDDPRGGAANDYVCYKAKCTGSLPANTTLADQFATHTVQPKKAKVICAPVDKQVCGDGDVDPGETCDGADDAACPGSCQANCTCETCEASFPACGGTCPPGQVCGNLGGACSCAVPACEDSVPTCGGACPAGQTCGDVGATCACLPDGSTPCGSGPFPACAGDCPQVGQTCTTHPDATVCFCSSGSCGSFPSCGGPCLPGEQCFPSPIGDCLCLQ